MADYGRYYDKAGRLHPDKLLEEDKWENRQKH